MHELAACKHYSVCAVVQSAFLTGMLIRTYHRNPVIGALHIRVSYLKHTFRLDAENR